MASADLPTSGISSCVSLISTSIGVLSLHVTSKRTRQFLSLESRASVAGDVSLRDATTSRMVSSLSVDKRSSVMAEVFRCQATLRRTFISGLNDRRSNSSVDVDDCSANSKSVNGCSLTMNLHTASVPHTSVKGEMGEGEVNIFKKGQAGD